MRERLKTVTVAIVLCLNIGIDPPDVVKTNPCAKLECWVDPLSLPPQKALETIGRNLQQQYEVWQPRARYKLSLDPSVEETKKLCCSLRKFAREDRVLFHYNGHGVPKPTPGGEIWVFNKDYTQYIPVSLFDLQSWLGSPSICVFDCSNAGHIIREFARFAEQRDQSRQAEPVDENGTYTPMKDCILFAACGPNEVLPMNPDLPSDLFTCCLTTPIEIALRWFVSQNPLITNITPDIIMKIPGRLNDRRTPLGELNWIFTAITDTIAWNVFPHDLFKRLFRQDLMVAALFRNYLLAVRIMRHHSCTPMSTPALPPTHQHPMWSSWDLAAEMCLSQLPALLKAGEGGGVEYKHSSFFSEQLTAFEVWLTKGAVSKGQPEQLPIVLQVLLSQVHRLRALMLLSRFLDLGPSSVKLALSVGIFPYVLKLLQSPAAELKPVLVFIWAKILAVDRSCQNDLLKDNGFTYFINILTATNSSSVIPNISEHRAMCAFILSIFCHDFRAGQEACMKNDLLSTLVLHLDDQDSLLRQWICIGLGKLWEGYNDAKILCFRENVNSRILSLLTDPVAEVRAAAMFAIGTLIKNVPDRPDIASIVEYNVGAAVVSGLADASPIVRKELVIVLSKFASCHWNFCITAALELAKEDKKRFRRTSTESTSSDGSMQTNGPSTPRPSQSIYMSCVKALYSLSADPFPYVAALASHVVDEISLELMTAHSITPSQVHHVTSTRPASIAISPRVDASPAKPASSLKRSASFAHPFKATLSSLIAAIPSVATTITPAADIAVEEGAYEDGEVKAAAVQMVNCIKDVAGFSAENLDISVHLKSGVRSAAEGGSLESIFFDWSLEYFLEPQMRVPEMDDPGSQQFNGRLWRKQRNDRIAEEAATRFGDASVKKFENQVCFLHSDDNPGALLAFHSFETHIVGADHHSGLVVYDWAAQNRRNLFSNGNPPRSRITSIKFINEDDAAMLLVASDEGVVRVYRNYQSPTKIELVSSWKALNASLDYSDSPLLSDWQQTSGSLLVAGDPSLIRVWDLDRELCVQDIPTRSQKPVTALTSEKLSGNLVVAGFGDGGIRLFDRRAAPTDSLVASFSEHQDKVLCAQIQQGDNYNLISGSIKGDVRIWDIRQRRSVDVIDTVPHGVTMTALAIHEQASIFACGTNAESIRVFNTRGVNISTIRYNEGFLGPKIFNVGCLAFHPQRALLAAGTMDNASLSLFASEAF
ncbi:raptor N-terminal caspase like domain-containing protein [Zopfochytrium polystomum]|nr:raptor N-terminal caspase like domain-containing protein [Zopfochytrium polystomum]